MRRLALIVALALGLGATSLSGQGKAPADVSETVAKIGEYVQQYFTRAQSIVYEETVRIQYLGYDLMSLPEPPRTLVNELRVSWDAAPQGGMADPVVLRTPLKVNGRAPREKDRDKCFDPEASTPELLGSLFLPENRASFRYTGRPNGKLNGRPVVIIDAVDLEQGQVWVESTEDCHRFSKPGNMKWRVWADAETLAVMRIDGSLTGFYDVTLPPNRKERIPARDITVERSDVTVAYKLVHFTDPDESMLLPSSRETVQVIRSANAPRVRISSQYRNFRRFMTGGRIVQ